MPDSETCKIRLAYKNMLDRCYNPKNASFSNYGGRGISVCKQWLASRSAFEAWARSAGHAMNLSLDRIDNDKGYSPDNCRWSDIKTQLRNQRRASMVEMGGKAQNVATWAEETGIGFSTIWRRIFVYRWTPERALSPKPETRWEHGTRAGYEAHHCRCQECRGFNASRAQACRTKLVADRLETGVSQ